MMLYGHLPGLDVPASRICLGCATLGSDCDLRASAELLDAFVGHGGNHLDTAHIYAAWLPGGEGASERAIGAWLRVHGTRDALVIATKAGHPDLATGARRINEALIRQDVAESLERLGTDHIDLLYLHRDDPRIPVPEIIDILHGLVREGLVRAIGLSNWTPQRWSEAYAWADAHNRSPIVINQIGWNLAMDVRRTGSEASGELFMDSASLAAHRATRLPLASFRSQAGGFFSGKYHPGTDPACQRRTVRERYAQRENEDLLRRVDALAQARGTSPNQIALAWLLAQPFPVFPIVGCKSVSQVIDSCGAADVGLATHERDGLRC